MNIHVRTVFGPRQCIATVNGISLVQDTAIFTPVKACLTATHGNTGMFGDFGSVLPGMQPNEVATNQITPQASNA